MGKKKKKRHHTENKLVNIILERNKLKMHEELLAQEPAPDRYS